MLVLLRFGPRTIESGHDDDDSHIADLFIKQYGTVSTERKANSLLDGSGRTERSNGYDVDWDPELQALAKGRRGSGVSLQTSRHSILPSLIA